MKRAKVKIIELDQNDLNIVISLLQMIDDVAAGVQDVTFADWANPDDCIVASALLSKLEKADKC